MNELSSAYANIVLPINAINMVRNFLICITMNGWSYSPSTI